MAHTDKKTALNQGVTIFIFLAILTALEFFVAIALNAVAILAVVALIKGGLVLYYYMHIYKLNAEDSSDHKSPTKDVPGRDRNEICQEPRQVELCQVAERHNCFVCFHVPSR